MTEWEKMISQKIYNTGDGALEKMRVQAHALCLKYNMSAETEIKLREKILRKLLPHRKGMAYFQGPIYFDYGINSIFGENFYANFNLTVLDCGKVTIGDNVLIGPNGVLVTPVHPMRYQDRNVKRRPDGVLFDYEYAKPITIGNNCWLASNVTVIGGVTIGDGCVIGAGSVVTRDVPPNSFAAGNPCRVLRAITEADALALKKELFEDS